MTLKAPYPWFGGKSKIMREVEKTLYLMVGLGITGKQMEDMEVRVTGAEERTGIEKRLTFRLTA